MKFFMVRVAPSAMGLGMDNLRACVMEAKDKDVVRLRARERSRAGRGCYVMGVVLKYKTT